jgi:hypothetical protein
MKNLLEAHRNLFVLTVTGGTGLIACLIRPVVSTPLASWLFVAAMIMTVCAMLILSALTHFGTPITAPQALGGLLIFTGVVILLL